MKIFEIYLCCYFATNKKIAIIHLWHAIEPQTIYHLIVKEKVAEQHILGQDHCRGVYLPPSIKGEEIPFPRYSQFFIFRENLRWPPKVGKSTQYCCTTLWVKKFVPNHSIFYGFKHIHTFSFCAKIKDGRQKIGYPQYF